MINTIMIMIIVLLYVQIEVIVFFITGICCCLSENTIAIDLSIFNNTR